MSTTTSARQAQGRTSLRVHRFQDWAGGRDASRAASALACVGELGEIGYWRCWGPDFESVWSDEMFRLYGFEPGADTLTLADYTGRIHPEDRNRVTRVLGEALAHDRHADLEYRIVLPDGALRYVRCRSRREWNEAEKRFEIFGIVMDQTARLGRLRDLADEQAAARFVAENARDIISRTAVTGEVLYISKAVTVITGWRPEDFIGRSVWHLIHPDDLERVAAAMRTLWDDRRRRASTTIVYRFKRREGGWVWLQANPRLVKDTHGRVLECVDVIRDVTERKAQEAELAAARAAAEAAAAAKSEFLANMSHELRTPLTSILGFADLIGQSSELAPADRRRLERVRDAGRTLLAVVNDVLDFSKLEAGGLQLDVQPFALPRLLEDVAALVQGQAEEKGLALSWACDPDAPPLVGDATRLRQVLLNLASNAVKFTAEGEVAISARLTACDGDHAIVRIEVADTGIGIAPEARGRLFQRFRQIDGSISRRFGGTGLGLAICKRLVELMGGEIGVDSREGEGSTFWIEAPLPVAASLDVPAASPEPAVAPSRGLRVLVAEDHPANRELIAAVLGALGCEVALACDGVEAVEVMAAQAFDLVLMDMQMPNLDGPSAVRRIRSMGGPAAATPIAALTANVLPDQVAACRAAGMDAHLAKPIDARALAALLDDVAQGRLRARESHSAQRA